MSSEGLSWEADIHVKDADTEDNICKKLNIRLGTQSKDSTNASLLNLGQEKKYCPYN